MEPLDGAVIREVADEFYGGRTGHDSRVWSLLMYGLWRRHANARGGGVECADLRTRQASSVDDASSVPTGETRPA